MPGLSVASGRLTKRYGDATALDLDRLAVAPGEVVGLVGNNGAGKTTLLRLVLDLVAPTAGHVELGGVRVGGPDQGWKRRVGAYLDAGFLIDYLRPQEYLRFVGGAYGVGPGEVERRVGRWAGFLGEALAEGRLIRDLSLGNAGKVGIVAALVAEPDLVVLDEPFANLDPGARIALEGLIRQAGERGATVLVSSHDLDHVVDVCSRVLVLSQGRVVRDTPSTPGTLSELRAFFAGGGRPTGEAPAGAASGGGATGARHASDEPGAPPAASGEPSR